MEMTAAQLVGERLCTPQCLLAGQSSNTCDCPCSGRWHGALGRTPVPESAAFRLPLAAPQPGPHLIDELEGTTC